LATVRTQDQSTEEIKFAPLEEVRPNHIKKLSPIIAMFRKRKNLPFTRSLKGRKLTLNDIKRESMSYDDIKKTIAE
jgi:hypothetical protein